MHFFTQCISIEFISKTELCEQVGFSPRGSHILNNRVTAASYLFPLILLLVMVTVC